MIKWAACLQPEPNSTFSWWLFWQLQVVPVHVNIICCYFCSLLYMYYYEYLTTLCLPHAAVFRTSTPGWLSCSMPGTRGRTLLPSVCWRRSWWVYSTMKGNSSCLSHTPCHSHFAILCISPCILPLAESIEIIIIVEKEGYSGCVIISRSTLAITMRVWGCIALAPKCAYMAGALHHVTRLQTMYVRFMYVLQWVCFSHNRGIH